MAKTYDKYLEGDELKTIKADEMTNTFYEHTTQDVEGVLKSNKARRNEFSGWNTAKDVKSIAEIPIVVCYQWLQEDGILFTALPKEEMSKYLKKKLNDPQWSYLKTSEGKL